MAKDLVNEVKHLKALLAQLSMALEAIADAVVWVNPEGCIQRCNLVFADWVNQPPDALIGESLDQILPLTQSDQPVTPATYLRYQSDRKEEFELGERLIELQVTELAWDGDVTIILTLHDVTAMRQSQASLHQAEARYRSLFEHSTQGIFQTAPDGRCLHANPALAEIMGYSSADELMLTLANLTQQVYVNASRRQEFLDLVAQKGQVSRLESQIYRKDGSVIWISESARAVRDPSGQVLYYEGFVEDITERRQAEYQQQETVSLLQATLEATADGILVVDRARNAPVYNQKFLQLWSVPEDLMLPGRGDDRLQYLSEQTADPEGFIRRIWALFIEHPEQEVLDLVEMKDGRVFERYSQPQWRGNQIIGRVWSFRDITERERAAERLRQQQEFLRTVIDTDPNYIFVKDWDGRYVLANKAAAEFYQSTADEIMGKLDADYHPDPSMVERFVQENRHVIETGEEIFIPEEKITNVVDREEWLQWQKRPLRLPGSNTYSVLGIGVNITERKQAEEALRRSELKYRNLFENSQVGIGRTRLSDGLFLDANHRCAEILGYDEASELIGKRYAPEFYADPEARNQVLAEVMAQGEVRNSELALRQSDGSLHWGLISIRLNLEESCLDFVITDITERKRVEDERTRLEEELRQSKQFLDSLIDNIPFGVFAKDVTNDFRYVLFNKASESVLGFAREAGMGLNDYDLLPAEQADLHRQEDLMAIAHGGPLQMPEQLLVSAITPGDRFWARGWKIPLFDEEGTPTHVLVISENITERKHREDALRLIMEGTAAKTGSEFFQSCVRYVAEVLRVRYALVTEFTDETKSRVRTLATYGNGVFCENIEYDLDDTPCQNVLRGEICYYADGLNQRFPNQPVMAEIGLRSYLGIPMMDSDGVVLGHLAVLNTEPMEADPGRELILRIFAARAGAELERKQTDEALQRRAQVDSLLSSISRQFIDVEPEASMRYVLEAIAQFSGSERSCIFEYADSHTWFSLTHEWCAPGIPPLPPGINRDAPIESFPWFFQQILAGQTILISNVDELPMVAALEKAVFRDISLQSTLAVPMIHSDAVIGFLALDVLNYRKTWSPEEVSTLKLIGELMAIALVRYRTEAALRIAKDAAETANRAKSTFLANMSHELRTPLNAILGFAQLMERDAAPRQRDFLTTINRSGEHLLNLINDVLEMSKIEAGRITLTPTTFDLLYLLQTLHEMFRIRADAKRLALAFELDESLPRYVFTDEGKLRQVLINLLSNAVKFTEQGSVTLRAQAIASEVGILRLNDDSEAPAATLQFEVVDTGQGIAPEDLEHLFDPFVQTSGTQSREGTGLGLTISRQFVHLMGGEIQLSSTVGLGSRFQLTVRVALVDPPGDAKRPERGRILQVAPGQPVYRVLVVDDRQENRELIEHLLRIVGFETRTANDGQEAIAQWHHWRPHLIWMDMRMPGINGYEATRQIRLRDQQEPHPNVPSPKIIALTASAFEEQRANILAAGCDDLVRKPFREAVIFEKMTEHLGVEYLYEQDLLEVAVDNAAPSAVELSPTSLAVMPPDWIADLHQAARAVDADRIQQLIRQIPPEHGHLAAALSDLVWQFGFDEIYETTQELMGDR